MAFSPALYLRKQALTSDYIFYTFISSVTGCDVTPCMRGCGLSCFGHCGVKLVRL